VERREEEGSGRGIELSRAPSEGCKEPLVLVKTPKTSKI
jgi:hypothetical protein